MMVTSTDEILSAIQNAEKKLSAVYDEPQVETISTTLAVVSSLLLAAMLVTTVKFCQASASWEIVDVNRGLRRICGSLVSAVLSVLFVWCIIYPFGTWPGLSAALEVLGIRKEGLQTAVVTVGMHCLLFYLGSMASIFYDFFHGNWQIRIRLDRLSTVMFLKDQICAPIIEEIIFRGCIVRLLYNAGLPNSWIIILSSALFGLAHFCIHIRIGYKGAFNSKAVLEALVPTTYTSLFGAYSAVLLLGTGHLSTCICAHAISNALGNSCFNILSDKSLFSTISCCFAFLLGLVFFILAFDTATSSVLHRAADNSAGSL